MFGRSKELKEIKDLLESMQRRLATVEEESSLRSRDYSDIKYYLYRIAVDAGLADPPESTNVIFQDNVPRERREQVAREAFLANCPKYRNKSC